MAPVKAEELKAAVVDGTVVESGRCKICRAVAASSIYGVPSCRVCKGIFKRGIKKKFNCAHDNACLVKVDLKERCKACIYAKCLRKGMVPPAANTSATKKSPASSTNPVKPARTPKKNKTPSANQPQTPLKSDLPSGAALVDRYYEVKEDLKSLFEPSTAKPFRFFDNEDAGTEVDEFAPPSTTDTSFGGRQTGRHHFFCQNVDDDVVNDQAIPSILTGSASSSLPTRQSFFFSESDPRLAEGMRFLTLNTEEMVASLDEWKKNRPQIFADFKKVKKDANRKRKTFDR